ncbi:MAG: hypothetical protein ABIP94_21315, partial [Planctomycetota bacterium]
LVIWGDIAAPRLAPFFLAWEVPIVNLDRSGNGAFGRFYIDAKTGGVLHYQNDKHDCGTAGCTSAEHRARDLSVASGPVLTATPSAKQTAAAQPVPALPVPALPVPAQPVPAQPVPALPVPTTVTIVAWTRTGADAFSGLVNVPLPRLVVTVPGVGTRTTDANGEFVIDIASPVTITISNLDGTHHNPIAGPDAPSGSFLVTPGVNATIQLLSAGATSNQAAHTTTTWWIDRTNEWARLILGNTSQLNTADSISPNVNVVNTCNASYGGNTLNFFNAGGGCSNTAFSTVIAHEWGHGLDDRYGGIANSSAEGLSEGWGDITGMYQVDSPILGSGFQTQGVGIRNGNNNRLWPYAATTGNPPPPHPAGEVWMGFAWRLRDNLRAAFGPTLAIDISNDIVIGSIVADATTRVDATREVFIADDDDGNLLNGTPHYAQLSAAAIAKNLPYPQQVVAVITHSALPNTSARLTPREVAATVQPVGGTIAQVRLHFNEGAGNVVRNMHPTGATNGYRALLPGKATGSVSYHIEAVHSGGTTVRLPATGEYAYAIDAPLVNFFSTDFETGSVGWTSAQVLTQNDWQIGDPAGKSGTSSGVAWADPQTAASGVNCYANDLGNTIGATVWNGAYAANAENYLRSPVIDCTGRIGVTLRFKRWLTVEDAAFDQATISVNGIQVWQNPVGSDLVDTAWQTVTYALPTADNNPAVQIEWRLKADGALQLGGWTIDDVSLGVPGPSGIDAELTLLPEQAVQGSPLVLTVVTPGGSRPFFLGLGDAIGPTIVPGLPIFFVGGNVLILGGSTDASGNAVYTFPAPGSVPVTGELLYSQVLTVDPTFTNFVVSNRFFNLFTQTP